MRGERERSVLIKNALVIGTIVVILLVSAHYLKPKNTGETVQFAVIMPDCRVGGVYSVRDRERYRVVKILAQDAKVVHIRVYKNTFFERPTDVDLSTLSLGTVHDPDGFGIGHIQFRELNFPLGSLSYLRRRTLGRMNSMDTKTGKRPVAVCSGNEELWRCGHPPLRDLKSRVKSYLL
ncbi:MAG: hypothetical protein DMG93_02135 [Acidobacteria bacterium]|nr:MAG: hypothetical protein DMG93_02135 [Acidobacteriota bacterium]